MAKQPVKKSSKVDKAQEKTWVTFTHLAGFAGFLVPFGNIIGPFVIWILKRDEFPAVRAHGKDVLNFQLSIALYYVVALASMLIIIGFVLLPAVAIFQIVCIILATIRASEGQKFQYPLSIRFIH